MRSVAPAPELPEKESAPLGITIAVCRDNGDTPSHGPANDRSADVFSER